MQILVVTVSLGLGALAGGLGMEYWRETKAGGGQIAKLQKTVAETVKPRPGDAERNAKLDDLLSHAENLPIMNSSAMLARQKQYLDLLTPADLPRARDRIMAAARGEKVDPTFLMAAHPLWALEDTEGLAQWLETPPGRKYQYSSQAFEMLGRAYAEKEEPFKSWDKMQSLFEARGSQGADLPGVRWVAAAAIADEPERAVQKALTLRDVELKVHVLAQSDLAMKQGDLRAALALVPAQVPADLRDRLESAMIGQAIGPGTEKEAFKQMGSYLLSGASENLRRARLTNVMYQWGLRDPASARPWMTANEAALKAYGLAEVRKDLAARAAHDAYSPDQPAPGVTDYEASAYSGPGGSAEARPTPAAPAPGQPAAAAAPGATPPSVSPAPSVSFARQPDPATTMDVLTYAGMHPKDAMARLAEMPAEQSRRIAPRLLRGIAEYDPELAAKTVLKLPAEQRADAATDVMDLWMQTNPAGAVAWLDKQVAGPVKDAGIVRVVKYTSASDPEGAALWALQAKGEGLREEQLALAAQSWRKINPQEARAWVQSQKLPPATVQAFLSGLE